MMTEIEVNALKAAEIEAWRKYKAALDEASRLHAIWFSADTDWRDARKKYRAMSTKPTTKTNQ